MRNDSRTKNCGGSLSAICREVIISGGDATSNGMNETGWQKDGFNLRNHDSNTNPTTVSLSFDGAESHYQTSARKSTSSSQYRSSLLIVCPPSERVRMTSIFLMCVCLHIRNGLRILR